MASAPEWPPVTAARSSPVGGFGIASASPPRPEEPRGSGRPPDVADHLTLEGPPDIERLKTRPQFLAAAKGPSRPSGAVVIQARHRRDNSTAIRFGFTATRRVGGAVERNRAKRRLRAAARLLAPLHGRP